MRHRRAVRIVVVVVALSALVLVAACGPPDPPPPSSPAAADIVERHNYIRGLDGVGALTVDGEMQAHAQLHADRLAAGASGCVGTLWHSSIAELGSWYPAQSSAENVACVSGCPTSGQQAFDLWMASPSHHDNMVRPDFAFIGVATRCTGSVMMVVAQYRSG